VVSCETRYQSGFYHGPGIRQSCYTIRPYLFPGPEREIFPLQGLPPSFLTGVMIASRYR
jgi:hypothetical protein